MSVSTYARTRKSFALAALFVVMASISACGSRSHHSAGTPTSRPTTPKPLTTAKSSTSELVQEWPCLAGSSARQVTLATSPILDFAVLGTGSRAVVLSNESDQELCSWLSYAKTLAGAGLQVALYDYVGGPRNDIAKVVGYLRGHGAKAVALMGASEGAKGSIIEASAVHPQALVSLSAENLLSGVAVAPHAATLHAPTMYVTASDDPYNATVATKGYYKSSPAAVKRLIVVPGTAHGTALLGTASVTREITKFLLAYDRP